MLKRKGKYHRLSSLLATSGLLFVAAGVVIAQEPNPTSVPASPQQVQSEEHNGVLIYKIQVVARDITAINYFHRSGATKIGFEGTPLLPNAHGEAKVNAGKGSTSIEIDLTGLPPANGFGPEYLTYVLWAITPEGRPVNLGEVLPTGSKDKDHLVVTTDLQAYGLIVTAEPYYAVTMPSDLVVLQNVVTDKTQGVIEQVNAHYTLLPRGAYAETAGRHAVLNPIRRDERSPLEIYEAINAVRIADAAGASQYAGETLSKAKLDLQNAEGSDTHKSNRKEAITYAREAVQTAEDARIITIRRIKEQDDAAQAAAEKQAQLVAAQQSEKRAQAEDEAAQARAQAEQAQAQADQAHAAQMAAEQAANQANQQAQTASQQADQARERLRQQLNQVLQTTETARGLIVNMSDVLFDFNKFTLKPEAREKLAKVSGILLSYPDLKLQVEGYTDNIGSDQYNQKLSEERADGVRDYLVSQSVNQSNITAQGYGKSDPIADNSTNAGRAQNRRVELVVSGAAIGIHPTAPGATGAQAAPQPASPTSNTAYPAVASPARQ